MTSKLDSTYWDDRYRDDSTGWDLKEISPPLKAYIDQLENKDLKILIPGGGYSYEAQYLWEQGFKKVYVVDFSELALARLTARVPHFASAQLIRGDFFELYDTFDLILEQTFFCALDPSLRPKYVQHIHHLLEDNGKLVGLLFNFPLTEKGPPYGGSIESYKRLFEKYFDILIMEHSHNSASSREDKELFVNFIKK